jgi:hypothetical protein
MLPERQDVKHSAYLGGRNSEAPRASGMLSKYSNDHFDHVRNMEISNAFQN